MSCWDPRDRSLAGTLDTAGHCLGEGSALPQVAIMAIIKTIIMTIIMTNIMTIIMTIIKTIVMTIIMTITWQVTAITHRDGLNMAVGSSTGKVVLYDLRSSKPLLVKDHMYGLPIKKVVFSGAGEEEGRVLSMDSQVNTLSPLSHLCYSALSPWHMGLKSGTRRVSCL